MEYCGPRGIPHEHFLGGPPGWTQTSRDRALWWLIHDRERCPHCGLRNDDFRDDPHAWGFEPEHCRGCELLAQGQDWLEANKQTLRRGTAMRAHRRRDG